MELQADKDFDPSRPVLSNTMTRVHDDMEENLEKYLHIIPADLADGLPFNLLQLFNGAYEILLTWLYQVFDRHGSKDELRAIETLAFMPYMTEIIRPLMEVLTKVPIRLNDASGTLGAGFEVTSNNFLIPKPEITHKITIERLSDLITLSTQISDQISKSNDPVINYLIEDFYFIRKSLAILKEEFENRVLYGWPATNIDLTKSESPDSLKSWAMRGPAVLELKFQGWFQCRLASDPDGANEKRGITGNNFAIGDQPDLDRIIRFQPSSTIIRSHCPEIGVYVITAKIIAPPIDLYNVVKEVPDFIGAKIDLLDSPKFEGRNHMVSDDGEPIDPFELRIETNNGIVLSRAVIGNGEINDMTSGQRAGSGRYVTNGGASTDAVKEYLKRIGKYTSPHSYLDERIALLKADLAKIPPDQIQGLAAEKLLFRLQCLDEAKMSSVGKPVAGGVRWSRYFFFVDYLHTISGKPVIDMNKVDLGFTFRKGHARDVNEKWLIEYHFGFFDSDALSAYAYGTIKIPVEIV